MSEQDYRYFVIIPTPLRFPPQLFRRRAGARDEAWRRVGEHEWGWAPDEKVRRAEVGGTTDDIFEVPPEEAEETRQALIEYAKELARTIN